MGGNHSFFFSFSFSTLFEAGSVLGFAVTMLELLVEILERDRFAEAGVSTLTLHLKGAEEGLLMKMTLILKISKIEPPAEAAAEEWDNLFDRPQLETYLPFVLQLYFVGTLRFRAVL
jgi:hypothetical protein